MRRELLLCLISIAVFMGCPKKEAVKPEQPEPAKEVAKEVAKEPEAPKPVRITLESIYFDFDKSNIREGDAEILKKNAERLKANPGVRVTIEGNCDERGSNEYNMALGERRAKSVRDYLVTLGIDAKRFTILSYGEEKPVCSEHEETCWRRNRRADLVVK